MLHKFIDFKRAFDRVWHAGLWQVPRTFNIDEGLVQAIHALFQNSSSEVVLNTQLGEFFKKTVGVRHRCLLSPILFNLFLEKTIQEIPHDRHISISIGVRPIYNLRFADGIDLMSGSGELQDLTNRLVDRAIFFS